MPSFGGIACFSLDGVPKGTGTQLEAHVRPGCDLADYVDIGSRGDEFTLRFKVDAVNTAGVTSGMEALFTMQGQTWTVVDNHNKTWFNILLLKVVQVVDQRVGVPVGGVNEGEYWLEVDLVCTNLSVYRSA